MAPRIIPRRVREVVARMRFYLLTVYASLFVVCVLVAALYRSSSGSLEVEDNAITRQLTEASSDDDRPNTCADLVSPAVQILILTLGVIYMFCGLAIVCDEFFVPALEVMAEKFELKDDVAGATLMAAGGSAPELFTSLIGTFNGSDVGIGTVVGSAVFNVLFVIGMCALFSKGVLALTWWPLFRDCCWYIIALSLLGGFFANGDGSTILWFEALVMLLLYCLYVTFMWKNETIEKWFKEKVLPARWGLSEQMDSEDDNEGDDSNACFTKNTHFRAGILQLLLQDHFDVDNLGVHLVSSIKGSASQVFEEADDNKNGLLEPSEIGKLLERLGLDASPAAAANAVSSIKRGVATDGAVGSAASISKKEFVVWYLTCEERIKALVGKSFEECDTNSNGKIEYVELQNAVKQLTGKTATPDELWGVYVDLGKLTVDQTKPRDIEATMRTLNLDRDEFSRWYFNSMFWTERAAELEAAAESEEGIDLFHIPFDKSLDEQIRFVMLSPLTISLGITLVNAQDEGKEDYCYYAFVGSIIWIGVYSYLMVTWATIIGAALGIPDILMGLTFLAAGTSVPDLLSSVIVARQGFGDMAVSSSIGSNIFDVCVGLPVPWLLYMAAFDEAITVDSRGVALSIFILLAMLFVTVISIMCSNWKLTPTLGWAMFGLYFVYVAQELARAATTDKLNNKAC